MIKEAIVSRFFSAGFPAGYFPREDPLRTSRDKRAGLHLTRASVEAVSLAIRDDPEIWRHAQSRKKKDRRHH